MARRGAAATTSLINTLASAGVGAAINGISRAVQNRQTFGPRRMRMGRRPINTRRARTWSARWNYRGPGPKPNSQRRIFGPKNIGRQTRRRLQAGDSTRNRNAENTNTINAPPSAVAGDIANISNMALSASNQYSFPRLASLAAQFQYFKFNHLVIDYSPTCGTDEQGTLYMGIVSDPSQLSSVKTQMDILALPTHASGPIWQPLKMPVGSGQMNTQLDTFQCRDGQTTDWSQMNLNQGYLVWTVTGCDGIGTGKAFGILNVTYDCSLSRPMYNADSIAMAFHAQSTAFTTCNNLFTANAFTWKDNFETNPVTFTASGNDDIVKIAVRRPVVVDVMIYTNTANSAAAYTFTPATGTKLTSILSTETAKQSCYKFLLIGDNPSFTVHCKNTVAHDYAQADILVSSTRSDIE